MCVVLSVFLVTLSALYACAPTTLDLHVRSASEFRLLNDQALPPLRAFCPPDNESEPCAQVTAAQHAFVDAHVAWVIALQSDVSANRWRFPEDTAEVVAFCHAFRFLVEKAEAIDVQFVPLSPATLQLCVRVP